MKKWWLYLFFCLVLVGVASGQYYDYPGWSDWSFGSYGISDIVDLYYSYPYWFDFFISLIIFISLGKIVFGGGAYARGSKGLTIGLSLALSFGLVLWESRTGFNLGDIWWLALLILVFAVGYAIYRRFSGVGFSFKAAAIMFLVLAFIVWYFFGDYFYYLPDFVLNIFYLLMIIAGIYVFVLIIGWVLSKNERIITEEPSAERHYLRRGSKWLGKLFWKGLKKSAGTMREVARKNKVIAKYRALIERIERSNISDDEKRIRIANLKSRMRRELGEISKEAYLERLRYHKELKERLGIKDYSKIPKEKTFFGKLMSEAISKFSEVIKAFWKRRHEINNAIYRGLYRLGEIEASLIKKGGKASINLVKNIRDVIKKYKAYVDIINHRSEEIIKRYEGFINEVREDKSCSEDIKRKRIARLEARMKRELGLINKETYLKSLDLNRYIKDIEPKLSLKKGVPSEKGKEIEKQKKLDEERKKEEKIMYDSYQYLRGDVGRVGGRLMEGLKKGEPQEDILEEAIKLLKSIEKQEEYFSKDPEYKKSYLTHRETLRNLIEKYRDLVEKKKVLLSLIEGGRLVIKKINETRDNPRDDVLDEGKMCLESLRRYEKEFKGTSLWKKFSKLLSLVERGIRNYELELRKKEDKLLKKSPLPGELRALPPGREKRINQLWVGYERAIRLAKSLHPKMFREIKESGKRGKYYDKWLKARDIVIRIEKKLKALGVDVIKRKEKRIKQLLKGYERAIRLANSLHPKMVREKKESGKRGKWYNRWKKAYDAVRQRKEELKALGVDVSKIK